MNLGKRLKAARKVSGLTQAQLATKLGVATITIQQYEGNKRIPSLIQCMKLSDALDMSMFDMVEKFDMDLEDNPPNTKKAARDEISFSDFDYALIGEVRELDDDEKQEILRNAQRFNELRKLRKEKG